MTRWRGTMSKAESEHHFNLFRGDVGQIRDAGWYPPILTNGGRLYAVIGNVGPRETGGIFGHPVYPHHNDNTEKNP